MTDKVPLLTAETADWCETMLRNKSTVRDDSFSGSRVQAELIAVRERRAIVVPADAEALALADAVAMVRKHLSSGSRLLWRKGATGLPEGSVLYTHPPADTVRELVEALGAFACACRWRCESMEWLPADNNQCSKRHAASILAKHRGRS